MTSTTVTAGTRSVDWGALLVSFSLALPLLWLSDAFALAVDYVLMTTLVSAAAPFLAGLATARIRATPHGTEAGFGAASAVLAVSIAELRLMEAPDTASPLLALLLTLVVAASFLIARSGARIGAVLWRHRAGGMAG